MFSIKDHQNHKRHPYAIVLHKILTEARSRGFLRISGDGSEAFFCSSAGCAGLARKTQLFVGLGFRGRQFLKKVAIATPSQDPKGPVTSPHASERRVALWGAKMSHGLNSLKGGYIGDYAGDYYRAYSGGY